MNMTELNVTLNGPQSAEFNGDYPEGFNYTEANSIVVDTLLDYLDMDIHQLESSFQVAREYSPPGMMPQPDVGTLHVSEDEYSFEPHENPLQELDA